MRNKTVISKTSYSLGPKKPVSKDALRKAGLVTTSVWLLAAVANMGFVLGKIPSSNEISSYRDSALVEQYRQEQIVDLDELRSEGEIDDLTYEQRKEEINEQSKSKIADIVYANDEGYQGAVKTNEALSWCSIAANCIVISSALTYLGITIKRAKIQKKESEQTEREMLAMLEKLLKDDLSSINSDEDDLFNQN